jgi:urease accessory protein
VEASTHLVVRAGPGGRSVVELLACEVPLLFRQAAGDGPHVTLVWVNGAGGPLGGDRLRLRVEICDGASLHVVSSGASIAQPGASGGYSTLDVDVVLGDGAHLRWQPEPAISVRRSDHRSVLRIVASPTATAQVVERARWGRAGEDGGVLGLRQRLEVGGAVVLDHELVLGGGALAGPGANGVGRAMCSVLHLGGTDAAEVAAGSVVRPGAVAAVLPLGHGAVLVTAGADDLAAVDPLAALDPLLDPLLGLATPAAIPTPAPATPVSAAPPLDREPSTKTWC